MSYENKWKVVCVLVGVVLFFLFGLLMKVIFGHAGWQFGIPLFIIYCLLILTHRLKGDLK